MIWERTLLKEASELESKLGSKGFNYQAELNLNHLSQYVRQLVYVTLKKSFNRLVTIDGRVS